MDKSNNKYMGNNIKCYSQFRYIEDSEEFFRVNEGLYDDKHFTANPVRVLYINITKNDREIERYAANQPCELSAKVGLCSWNWEEKPNLRGLYNSYKKGRGRNACFMNGMHTVLLYPFNRYITKKIDKLIIRLLESIHKDMNQDIVCSWNKKRSDDPRVQESSTEIIEYGLTQKYVQLTMFIIYAIEEELFESELFDLLFYQSTTYSETTKDLLRKIKDVLTNANGSETNKSIDSYIKNIDFRVTTSSVHEINNSILFKYIPDDWDLNHNSLFLSFDKYSTNSFINRIASRGYVSNVNIVELSKEQESERTIHNIRVQYKKEYTSDDMRREFDNITSLIINPPYDGDLYRKFLVNAYNMLACNGKMMFICPAAFLNDQRYNSNADSVRLRKSIEKHVVKVIIENFNQQFETRNYHPFAIIFIDKTKHGKQIEFICNGEKKTVDNINDCNINGNSALQISIQRKMMGYSLLTKDRMILKCILTKKEKESEEKKKEKLEKDRAMFDSHKKDYFVTFNKMLSTVVSNSNFNKDEYNINGLFYSYSECYVHHNEQRVLTFDEADRYRSSGQYNWFFYGTKEEMENWIYNSMNLKIMKAFAIIRFLDQNNQVFNKAPFLCDKKYTDEEAYDKFNIDAAEQKYIDELLKQYEMNGEWFQRYITGN